MKILVTGGAGYIGSHTCIELLNAGYEVVVIDNLSNANGKVIGRIEEIAGRGVAFYEKDVRDEAALEEIFSREDIQGTIHFAGYKAVGESVEQPLMYYRNNLDSTLVLCGAMQRHDVKNLIFSSSATVYGNPKAVPIREDFPLSVTNPYGRTKLMIEEILQDLHTADSGWNIVLLRYFNPIGAHKSGLIGEDPRGIPNNLLPYITQVAVGRLERLGVFGNDYNTKDGTGVRDYIHVVDLALGHVKAIGKFQEQGGVSVYNLGTGKGYSVLEMVQAFEQASGRAVPYDIKPRRPGDIDACYADPQKAKAELGWEATLDILEMCADSWRWQSNNPRGYEE